MIVNLRDGHINLIHIEKTRRLTKQEYDSLNGPGYNITIEKNRDELDMLQANAPILMLTFVSGEIIYIYGPEVGKVEEALDYMQKMWTIQAWVTKG